MTNRMKAAVVTVVCALGLGAAFVATPARGAADTVNPGQTITLPGLWSPQVLGQNTLPTPPSCANAPASVTLDQIVNGQVFRQVTEPQDACTVSTAGGFYVANYDAPGDFVYTVPDTAADGSTVTICYNAELPAGAASASPSMRCTVPYTVVVPSPSTSNATTTTPGSTTTPAPVGGPAPAPGTQTVTTTVVTCDATCQALQAQIDQLKADLAQLEQAFAALDAALIQDGVAVPDYTGVFPSTDLVAPITVTANPTGGTANTTQGVLAVH